MTIFGTILRSISRTILRTILGSIARKILKTISWTILGFYLVFPQLYSLYCAVVAMRMSD
jgi:hypothetical protein